MDLVRRLFRMGKEATPERPAEQWASAVDEAGQTYYYNTMAGAPSPDLPEAEPYDPEKMNFDDDAFDALKKSPLGIIAPFPFLKLRADLRRNVLEFVLVASKGSAMQRVRQQRLGEDDIWPGTRACVRPVPPSAAASLRTVVLHTKTTKAVCKAVCADVRLLERTTVKPEKWLECLWLVDPGTKSRDECLVECRDRAVVARSANVVTELYGRLGMCCGPNLRDHVTKCPATWPKERTQAVELLVKQRRYLQDDEKDVELSLAHTRVQSREESRSLAEGDEAFLRVLARTAFDRFAISLRRQPWTMILSSVKIVYRGPRGEGEDRSRRMRDDPADCDALATGLATFFGAERMRGEPWVQGWRAGRCSGSVMPSRGASPAPLPRLLEAIEAWHKTEEWRELRLTNFGIGEACVPAATLDLKLGTGVETAAQAEESDDDEDPQPPTYMFISPVESLKCRSTGNNLTGLPRWPFKIATSVHSDKNYIYRKSLDEAILFLSFVPDVFDAVCECTIVGLN